MTSTSFSTLRAIALALVTLTGCSLVIDTNSLTAGKAALRCSDEEKICPIDSTTDIDLFACTPKSVPETGCGDSSCQPCAVPGAVARCNAKQECAIAVCSGRNENCDNKEENGCEVNLGTDPDNCGACGRACSRDNAITDCVNAVCETVLCLKPFDDCDGDLSNGCETNTSDNLLHCGGCKQKCDGTCSDGTCIL